MKKESRFLEFYKKFRKHKLANIGMFIVALEIILVIILPFILELDPYSINPVFNQAPCAEHLLGTDDAGRDMLSRVIYGGRTSLFVGFSATVVSIILGIPLGLIAGYYRGVLETVIMRAADIFLSFPSMILVLVMAAIFGNSIPILIIIIGVLGWPQIARLIYGNVLSVRKKEYIEAAKAAGTSDLEILLRYVLPNSISPIWMNIAFQISSAILTESALSFLGAGVKTPQASWGNIIHAAQNIVILSTRPWIWMSAGICLIITIVSINFVGEGVRDALDPKMKR